MSNKYFSYTKKGKGTKAPIKDFQDPLLREEQV